MTTVMTRPTDDTSEVSAVAVQLGRKQPWRDHAACLGEDHRMFFQDEGGIYDEARAVCGRCLVREKCLDAHIGENHGYFGMMTPKQRRKERRRRTYLKDAA